MEINSNTKENMLTMSKWMQFMAVVFYVLGGLYVVSCIGLIVCWVPILMGLWLWQSAQEFQKLVQDGQEHSFDTAIEKLKTYFMFTGIVTIVIIVLYVLIIIGYIIFFAALLQNVDNFQGLFDSFK